MTKNIQDTLSGANKMKISPLELVYGAAIICALILGDTPEILLGVSLGGVLVLRRLARARYAHHTLVSAPKNH